MKKAYRILSHDEFSSISKKGHRLNGEHTSIRYITKDSGNARVGITVTKKNGNAVTRNLIKRQIRSIIDENLNFNTPIDLVVYAKYSYDPSNFHLIKSELTSLLSAIGEKH